MPSLEREEEQRRNVVLCLPGDGNVVGYTQILLNASMANRVQLKEQRAFLCRGFCKAFQNQEIFISWRRGDFGTKL